MPIDLLNRFEDEIEPELGVKYSSLEYALQNYYASFQAFGGDLGTVLYNLPCYQDDPFYNDEDFPLYNDNHLLEEYTICFINTIVAFHHFFELHIQEVLSEYNDLLNKKIRGYHRVEDIPELLNELDNPNLRPDGEKSVNFRLALEILKQLSINRNNTESKYKLKDEHIDLASDNALLILRKLQDLRNDSLHKGNKVLRFLAFDYYVTQCLLPLVHSVLKKSEYHYKKLNRSVACKKNILKEILNISFSLEDLTEKKDNDVFEKSIAYLAHLKELGRASFLRINTPFNELKARHRNKKDEIDTMIHGYNRSLYFEIKKYKLAERLALIESKSEKVAQRLICPCCGAKTLLSYWKLETPLPGVPKAYRAVTKASCKFCTYKIDISLGEPKKFNILKVELFSEYDDIGWPFPEIEISQEQLDKYEDNN